MKPTPSTPPSQSTLKDLPITILSTSPKSPAILLRNSSSAHPPDTLSMPPPPRPTISTQTSFEPQPHLLYPPPLSSFADSSQTQEGSPTDQPPRAPFTPFFTLVNDITTQSTHHPSRIHYIFSDDDSSEVFTNSLFKSLRSQQNQDSNASSPAASRESLSQSSEKQRSSTISSSSSATFRKEKRTGGRRGTTVVEGKKKEREERVIIVDINESGNTISSVSSLSPDWQVLDATLSSAPTFDGPTETSQPDDKGLMLRIEGVGTLTPGEDEEGREGLGIKGRGGVESNGVMAEEEINALLEGFDRKMGILRRIMGAADEYGLGKEGEKSDVPAEV